MAAVDRWADSQSTSDPDYWHHVLEALWLHQSHNVVDEDLLKRVQTCPEPKARAAATRVLCYGSDRVSQPLELLRKQVNDENPAPEFSGPAFPTELSPGHHTLTFRVDISARKNSALRVEVPKPPGSTAEYAVVGGR